MRLRLLAALVLLACLPAARAEGPAVVYNDAASRFSLSLPVLDVPDGETALLAELPDPTPRPKGFEGGISLSVVREEATRDVFGPRFLAKLTRSGHKILSETAASVDSHDACLVDSLAKNQGEECRYRTVLVFAKSYVLVVQSATRPAELATAEGPIRASLESIKIGGSFGEGSLYANGVYGFSIVPPVREKAKPGGAVFRVHAFGEKTSVEVRIQPAIRGAKEAARDAIVKAYGARGATVSATSFRTVSERDAVLVEAAGKGERRLDLHVLDAERVLLVSCSGPEAEVGACETDLRAVLGSVRLGTPDALPAATAVDGSKPAPVAPKATPAGPPKLAAPFVARPEFVVRGQNARGGTAWATEVQGESRLIVVTALHLFDTKAADMPGTVKSLTLHDGDSDDVLGVTTEALLVPDAYTVRNGKNGAEAAGDIAVFRAPAGTGLKPLPLAKEEPKTGEKVWLAARLFDGQAVALHEGKVVGVFQDALLVELPGLKKEQMQATSGAPYVNARGEVVGMNLASVMKDANVVAFANPLASLQKRIKAALEKR